MPTRPTPVASATPSTTLASKASTLSKRRKTRGKRSSGIEDSRRSGHRLDAAAAPGATGAMDCSRSSRFSCSTRRCSNPRADQGLQSSPIDLQILRGINAGLLGFAQRLGARSPESDDQDFRPALLDLIEEIPGFLRAQIQKKKCGTGLLKDSIQPIGRRRRGAPGRARSGTP